MPDPGHDHNAKRLARLAAVQALYRIALTQQPTAQILKEFRDQPQTLLGEGVESGEPDKELFDAIVGGVAESEPQLDEMIAGAIDSKFSAERLEILLRAILRAGAFELYRHSPIPAPVIINDYVDVAHAFFAAKEPGLVNAMLDRLAKNLRA